MPNFAIFDYIKKGNCIVPDVAKDMYILRLAHPYKQSWGLFEIEGADGPWPPPGVEILDRQLSWLLYSAKMYLPALVLALRDVGGEDGSKMEYLEALRRRLEVRLNNQRTDPYVLARVRETDGELIEGSYHWVLGYDRKLDWVAWASPDFFIYDDRREVFELTGEDLNRLPAVDLQIRGPEDCAC